MNGAVVHAYSKAKDGAVQLTTNFRVREFACQDGSDTIFVSTDLAGVLQKIRTHFGKPVTINSGYRTVAHNQSKQVEGSPTSQHLYGLAADIVVQGVAPKEVARYAETLLGGRGGIGLYDWGVHVDVRAKRSRWDSTSGREMAVGGF